MKRPGFVTFLAALNLAAPVFWFFAAFIWAEDESTVGYAVAGGFCLVAAAQIVSAIGLLKLKPFGRTLSLLFSFIWLLAFPFGTVASVLILGYLYRREVKLLFSGKQQEQLTEPERADLNAFAQTRSTLRAVAVAVVLFSGVVFLAAMLIPGMIGSSSHQKRTMADIRSIGTAVESYGIDNNQYPPAHSLDELAKLLAPTYIKTLPRQDGWGHDFRYVCWREQSDSPGPDSYLIASPGKDGKWETTDLRKYTESAFQGLDQDIVYKNGSFLRYPASLASQK